MRQPTSEDVNYIAPIAPGRFQRTWERLSSKLSPQKHGGGEDQIERSPAGSTKSQQHSPFSSSAFDRLAKPIPVTDVFFVSWWLVLALRTMTRLVVIYFSYFWFWTSIHFGAVWMLFLLGAFLIRWVVLKPGHKTVPLIGAPIPGKRQLFWTLSRWIQKIWEHVIARFALTTRGHSTGFCTLWWFFYLLITPMAEFEQNYMAAWRQGGEGRSIYIFVDDEKLSIPIPVEGTDEALLARVRTFYQTMLVGQGVPALVFMKQLQRIDAVELSLMSEDTLILGNRLGTLQLGRYKGRLVDFFENPRLGQHTNAVVATIENLPKNAALEFERTYDVGVISIVVAIPPVASLIFGIVWVRVYTHKHDDPAHPPDLQVIVATAFAVSSYIVTAGALTLALIAFLDQKRSQNDDMIEKIARRSVETKAVGPQLQQRDSVGTKTGASQLHRRGSAP